MRAYTLTSALRGPLSVAALSSLVVAGTAAAQDTMVPARSTSAEYMHVILRGVLYDDSSRAAIEGGTIVVVDSAGELMSKLARSDTAGHFEVNIASAGKYRVLARRDGFAAVMTSAIIFENGEVVDIELPLSSSGTPRSQGSIVSREPIALSMWEPEDFVRRREQGMGRFAGPVDLRHIRSRPISEMLAELRGRDGSPSGVRFVQAVAEATARSTSECPALWLLNGETSNLTREELAAMSTTEFRAIELYRQGEAPDELGPTARQCGAVVLWVR